MKKKMNKINYQLELDKIIKKLQKDNKTPTLHLAAVIVLVTLQNILR